MKKRLFSLVLVATMATSLLVGCGDKKDIKPTNTTETKVEETAAPTVIQDTIGDEDTTKKDVNEETKTEETTTEETAITTVTPGKLTIATSPDFAPYEFYAIDANGDPQLAGFDMALAQYIADYLGLELEVIPMDFDGTLTELAAKNVDLSLAGYSPDPSRMDKMDFSDIYYQGGQSFVTVKDKTDLFPTLADANKAE